MKKLLLLLLLPMAFGYQDVGVSVYGERMLNLAKFDENTVVIQGYKVFFDPSHTSTEVLFQTSSDNFSSHVRWNLNTGMTTWRLCGDRSDIRYDAVGNLYVLTRKCFIPFNDYANSFVIYRSFNQGLTWETFAEIGVPYCGLDGIRFLVTPDAQNFLVFTSTVSNYLTMTYSEDGGATWNVQHNVTQGFGLPYPAIIPDWENDLIVVMGMVNNGFRVRTYDLIAKTWVNNSTGVSTNGRSLGLSRAGWIRDDGLVELFVDSFEAQLSGRYRYNIASNTIEFIENLEKDGIYGQISKAYRDRNGTSHIYASFDGDLYRKRNNRPWELIRARGADEESITLREILTCERYPYPHFDYEGKFIYKVILDSSGEDFYFINKEYERDVVLLEMVSAWPNRVIFSLIERVNEKGSRGR